MKRVMLDARAGFALVPADPPLLPGEIEIDVSGLDVVDELSSSRTKTPEIDRAALEALLWRSR